MKLDADPKCPKCGKEVPLEAIYCPYCSTKLEVNSDTIKIRLEELRHNENVCHFLFVIGLVIALFGYWLGTLTEKHSFLFYEVTYHPHAGLAVYMIILGGGTIIVSSLLAVYYGYLRSKLTGVK
jgi:hypothetical protein